MGHPKAMCVVAHRAPGLGGHLCTRTEATSLMLRSRQGDGAGHTWGVPQSHCSPRSTNRFPHTGPPTSRSGSGALARQPVWGFSKNISRSALLHLLNVLGNLELKAEVWLSGATVTLPLPTCCDPQGSPNAARHDAAAALPWHRAVAALDVLVVVHAQVVAQLVGHGRCHANGVLAVVLCRGLSSLGQRLTHPPRPAPSPSAPGLGAVSCQPPLET